MSLVLLTDRLQLISSTLAMAEAEIPDRARFAAMLGVPIPSNWPPPLNDEQSQAYFINRLKTEPPHHFHGFYIVLREPRTLIGNSGFKTMPQDGCVEIGYSLLPDFHARGYGSEAAHALVAWAFTQPEVERVAAETLPHLRPSIRVMENCGMRFIGEGAEEEGMRTVHYEVTRAEFAALLK